MTATGYVELMPPVALREFVDCMWVHQIAPDAPAFTQPVLPDGCIDIVALDGHVLLAGPATRALTFEVAPGALTVGVRFRPGAAPALLGVSASEVRDVNTPIGQVWGTAAGDTIDDQLSAATDWRRRLDVITATLLDRRRRAARIDPVGVGIGELLDDRPERRVAELADEVGLSERQLRRRVEEAVGYSPKVFARILRFQRFLRAARMAGPGPWLAALAADAGYADQAHLTRECRELSGLPPSALLDWEARRTAG